MIHQRTLYVNARIHTMDSSSPLAEALLIEGDRIAAAGTRAELETADTRTVDLDGGTVIPGFNDCHCHVLSFGLELDRLDVSPEEARTIADIARAVARAAASLGPDGWILGRGYNQNDLEERRHPTRADLDEASRGHPTVLWHTSGHALTCNSRALALAGITGDTPTPPGGEIDRDEHGEPSGVLKESAMDLLEDVIPPPTTEEGSRAVVRAMEVMASQGITSACDAATGFGASIEPALAIYRAALNAGLSGRITLMPQIAYVAPPRSDDIHQLEEFEPGDRPDWLQVGPTKIFSDGALTTRTAALRQPFIDSATNRGILIWEPEVLQDMIVRAHRAGWQIGTHAIGDRAIEVVLDCYQAALADRPRDDHRHRIEHCMLLDEGLAGRIKDLGVVPTIQPGFMARLGDAYIAGLGEERAAQLMPMGLFTHLSIPVGFSSDRPVISGLPLEGVRSAVLRRTPRGMPLGREHAVSVMEAIRLYTFGSAFACHSEDQLGTLSPGKLADFTVLSHDPERMAPEDLENLRVVMTVAGGQATYQE